MKSNYAFLDDHFPALAGMGSLAEDYPYTDGNFCLIKLGLFAETMVNLTMEYDGVAFSGTGKTQTILGLIYRFLKPSRFKRILFNEADTIPAVSDYDLIVVDEAHRGYILDKELSDDEMLYCNQDDFISKYRTVIDYFDAVKVAMTATQP